ncbi:DsrH/TusB family sulfur relay protein [Pseudoalteromonas sp. GB56]
MSTLFIVSTANASTSALLSRLNDADAVLLRGDGCFSWAAFAQLQHPLYALERDMQARGLSEHSSKAMLISDSQWVELTLQFSKCVSE